MWSIILSSPSTVGVLATAAGGAAFGVGGAPLDEAPPVPDGPAVDGVLGSFVSPSCSA